MARNEKDKTKYKGKSSSGNIPWDERIKNLNQPFDLTIIENKMKQGEIAYTSDKIIKLDSPMSIDADTSFYGYTQFGENVYCVELDRVLYEAHSIKKKELAHYFTNKLNGWVKFYYCNVIHSYNPLNLTDKQKEEMESLMKLDLSHYEIAEQLSGKVPVTNVIDYCIKDVEILPMLWEKTGYLIQCETMMKYWKIPFSTAMYVNQSKWIAIHYSRIDEVRPLLKIDNEFKKVKNAYELEGGYVNIQVSGTHSNVYLLDFNSLYPTIINHFNISLETFRHQEIAPRDNKSEEYKKRYNELKKEYIVARGFLITPETNGEMLEHFICYDKERKGILSSQIHWIKTDRLKYKRKTDELKDRIKKETEKLSPSELQELQAKYSFVYNINIALKNNMNKNYGFLSSRHMDYYHPYIGASITGEGKYAKEFIEQELIKINKNYVVLSGDTDSIYFKDITDAQINCKKVLAMLNEKLKAHYDKCIFDDYQFELTHEETMTKYFVPYKKKCNVKIFADGKCKITGLKLSTISLELNEIIIKCVLDIINKNYNVSFLYDYLDTIDVNHMSITIKNKEYKGSAGPGKNAIIKKLIDEDPDLALKDVLYYCPYFYYDKKDRKIKTTGIFNLNNQTIKQIIRTKFKDFDDNPEGRKLMFDTKLMYLDIKIFIIHEIFKVMGCSSKDSGVHLMKIYKQVRNCFSQLEHNEHWETIFEKLFEPFTKNLINYVFKKFIKQVNGELPFYYEDKEEKIRKKLNKKLEKQNKIYRKVPKLVPKDDNQKTQFELDKKHHIHTDLLDIQKCIRCVKRLNPDIYKL
jgi:hypothetical protein